VDASRADAGLLCALLNIRTEDALHQSPAAGAIWEPLFLLNYVVENAAPDVLAVDSSGVTAHARWISLLIRADNWTFSKRGGPKFQVTEIQ
jgi:hypothetical protein